MLSIIDLSGCIVCQCVTQYRLSYTPCWSYSRSRSCLQCIMVCSHLLHSFKHQFTSSLRSMSVVWTRASLEHVAKINKLHTYTTRKYHQFSLCLSMHCELTVYSFSVWRTGFKLNFRQYISKKSISLFHQGYTFSSICICRYFQLSIFFNFIFYWAAVL